MDTKLTLKLNKTVIDKAKAYAAEHKKSLSGMIEAYLKSLIDKEADTEGDAIELSPFVKNMKTGVQIPSDTELKDTYRDHLNKKYQ